MPRRREEQKAAAVALVRLGYMRRDAGVVLGLSDLHRSRTRRRPHPPPCHERRRGAPFSASSTLLPGPSRQANALPFIKTRRRDQTRVGLPAQC